MQARLLQVTAAACSPCQHHHHHHHRAPCLHGAQHDVDPVRMHKLSQQEFWPHFRQRYGDNKNLVRYIYIYMPV